MDHSTAPLKKAILYLLPPGSPKSDGIRAILQKMDVATADLPVSMLNQTLGACFGLDGFVLDASEFNGEAPQDEVLVMYNFADEDFQELFKLMRAASLPRIGLMAALTEHNRSWSMLSLFSELAKERRIMAAWMRLQQAVKTAETSTATDAGQKDNEKDQAQFEFKKALGAAKAILSSNEPPAIETIQQAEADLNRYLVPQE